MLRYDKDYFDHQIQKIAPKLMPTASTELIYKLYHAYPTLDDSHVKIADVKPVRVALPNLVEEYMDQGTFFNLINQFLISPGKRKLPGWK